MTGLYKVISDCDDGAFFGAEYCVLESPSQEAVLARTSSKFMQLGGADRDAILLVFPGYCPGAQPASAPLLLRSTSVHRCRLVQGPTDGHPSTVFTL